MRLPGMEIGKRAETPQSSIEHFNDDNLNLGVFHSGVAPVSSTGQAPKSGFPRIPAGGGMMTFAGMNLPEIFNEL